MTKIETACESYNHIQNTIERDNKDPVCSDGYSNELNIVKVGPLSTTTSKVIGENALSNKMANSPGMIANVYDRFNQSRWLLYRMSAIVLTYFSICWINSLFKKSPYRSKL